MTKLIVETKVLDGIPLNEYYAENVDHLGLVILQHGFQSNKSQGGDYLAMKLARRGFFVITLDAYKHGDRIEEPFISEPVYKRYIELYKVIDRTSDDIIFIHDKYYKDRFPRYDLIGVSMGGFIAFVTSYKTNLINKLVPTITTINLTHLAENRNNSTDPEHYFDEIEEHLDFIREIDPSNHIDQLQYKSCFITSGKDDPIIGYTHNEKYARHNKDKVIFKLYDCGHETPWDMQQDIISFLKDEKVVQ